MRARRLAPISPQLRQVDGLLLALKHKKRITDSPKDDFPPTCEFKKATYWHSNKYKLLNKFEANWNLGEGNGVDKTSV